MMDTSGTKVYHFDDTGITVTHNGFRIAMNVRNSTER